MATVDGDDNPTAEATRNAEGEDPRPRGQLSLLEGTGGIPGRSLISRRLLATLALALTAVAACFALLLSPPGALASRPMPPRAVESGPALLPTRPEAWDGASREPRYTLALLSSRMEIEGGHVTVEGSVRNLTDRPIGAVIAVVTLYDENRVPRVTADTLIDSDPLLPGQASTWRTALADRRDLPLFGIEFRQWHVGPLPTRDDR